MKRRARGTGSRTSANWATTDYVAIAVAFAEDAIADTRRERFGKLTRLAARRFLADLKRAKRKRRPFEFSERQANRYCGFIENLPHVEGVWETPHIVLHPAHVFFVVQLFGFRHEDGSRRFTSGLFCVARKNAKSTLAAAILLACFCLEHELGPQVISAATTGQQARVVFNIAKRMVDATPDLRDAFDLESFANAIARAQVGGTFRPINSRASTQDGLNPSHVSVDEIHAHKTPDLLNVLRSAAGARRSPLFLYTTTEGYESPGPWHELRTFSRQVLERVIEADHFLAVLFAVDDEDDDFDESVWIKANPLISANPLLAQSIAKEAVEAKAMPGALSEFRIKRLNRQASTSSGFINLSKWRRCDGEVNLAELEGAPCWAAFDLAATSDINAWRLLWLVDDVFYTAGRYWVPAEAVRQRTERSSVNYAAWIAAGLMTQTDGDVADYAVIERDMLEDWRRFGPSRIAYDPWNATALATRLVEQGLPLEQFIQGPRSFNPAMKAFEIAYTSGHLRHGGDKVLTWMAANLVARTDVNLNLAPDRKRSADKIDGVVALLMTFGLAAQPPEDRAEGSVVLL